jgi:SnoaL-like domain
MVRGLVMTDLERRVAGLEAHQQLADGFAEYLYAVDGGALDVLADVYAEDGIFTVWDLPLGTGEVFRVQGRSALVEYYGGIPTGIFRHHALNTMIAIDEDLRRAQISSFLLVISGQSGAKVGYVGGAGGFSVIGGVYESNWQREHDRWRISHLHVANQYHWEAPRGSDPKFFHDLAYGTWHGGRPLTRFRAGDPDPAGPGSR